MYWLLLRRLATLAALPTALPHAAALATATHAGHAATALRARRSHAVQAQIARNGCVVVSEVDWQLNQHCGAGDLPPAKALGHFTELGVLCAIERLLTVIE